MKKNSNKKVSNTKPKKKKGNKSGFRKIIKVILITILCIFCLNLITTILYRWVNPPITLTMISRSVFDGEPLKKEWKTLDEISPYLVEASVASEDNMFLGHNGFDRVAIDIAIEEHKSGKSNRGGSGISQQTAKNVFLWQGHSWLRKGLEVYQTFLIELFWPKERIMEVYLNVIEMGHGIYGAEAASQEYFHKNAKDLSKTEASQIVAAYPNPRDPKRNPATPSARAAKIRKLMDLIGPIKFDSESIKQWQERYDAYKNKHFNSKKQ
jgi:monofunctional biosynthetic peptidoglycan transglycosylase